MKTLQLPQNRYTTIDDDDYEKINKWKWRTNEYGYAFRTAKRNGKKQILFLHREILGLKKGDGKIIDHKNRNTLDNRKCNLRICNRSQNRMNSKAKSIIGYKGVSWHVSSKKWLARIEKNKTSIRIGMFNNPKDAAKAYDEKAIEFFGEFACTNF